jgi:hypothetical protein
MGLSGGCIGISSGMAIDYAKGDPMAVLIYINTLYCSAYGATNMVLHWHLFRLAFSLER